MAYTTENTQGYTTEQLVALNAELAAILAAEGIKPGSHEAIAMEKAFADEVALLIGQ